MSDSRVTDAAGQTCCDDAWEEAYLRFESPAEETAKFIKRLRKLGVGEWNQDSKVVELFCGRGSGMIALSRLGFQHVEGVDLSPTLVEQYDGPGTCLVGDCRDLPFDDRSRDIVIVQGGLHHLETLPDDLDRTLGEMSRVLVEGGRAIVVEPWWTPFLGAAHLACRNRFARRLSSKVDALAIMIEHERATYEAWLAAGPKILERLATHFIAEQQIIGGGKLFFTGKPRAIS